MLSIPGNELWLCDGPSRREFLRIGGAAMMGISLPQILTLEARAKAEGATGQSSASFGKAKSVIMLFLQGGPSHIDIWDPKPDAPSNIRGEFNPIRTKLEGQPEGGHRILRRVR